MYRPVPNNRDRAATIGAVVLIHAMLGYALLNATGTVRPSARQADLQLIDIVMPPPPAVVEELPPPEPPKPQQEKPKEPEAAAAPRKLEKQASPVVAPRPRVVLPAPTPVVAAPVAGTGAATSQGASDVDGPGSGAGGAGSGTGSGSGGSGSGGGGSAPRGEPRNASIIPSTSLTLADFPPDVRRSWPRGGRVYVAVRVQLDGRATDCKVNRSIGIPAIDQWTCRLLEQKGRFRPAIDESGQPVVAWYGYVQAWTGS